MSLIAASRRCFIASLGGSLGALLFSGCAFAAGTAKIATVVWIGYGPFYIADQLDLFKKSGVKVSMQMFQDPALIPPAITGGTVDGGLITYDQVISSVGKGSTMKVVMPIDHSNGGDAIVAMGEGKKFHVIYSSKDAPGMITDVLVFKGEYIKKNPAVVKALIQGYIDGLGYMKKNPAEAAKLIGKVMGISDKEVMEQLPTVYNPVPGEFAKVFDKSTASTSLHVSGAIISKILKSKGEIKTIPKIEDTMDTSIAMSMIK